MIRENHAPRKEVLGGGFQDVSSSVDPVFISFFSLKTGRRTYLHHPQQGHFEERWGKKVYKDGSEVCLGDF